MPCAAAVASGKVTSFDTVTELDVTSSHVASEKDESWMIESSARSNTVALKSSHVIPAIPSDSATIGVRVGLGVGTGVWCAVVGTGVGSDVGAAVGKDDGAADGTDVGSDVGAVVGKDDGAADGTGVGTGVGDSTHALLTHASDEQSPPSVHARPTLQRGQSPPPQSTSVSVPSRMSFVQVSNVGMGIGTRLGAAVGAGFGYGDGAEVGTAVGAEVGEGDGAGVGAEVGAGQGAEVGAGEGGSIDV